ncbi:MAG: DNA mismatch repair protein MutS [Flavobacteriaceae bacterium]|nr:DNA mismatch repair protein MutS [Flavobacteriaceae bacterium]OUX39242.1 MAG: DNA mismatch repair protein MutS [Flavobacteriaceae bacterium TMED265]
MAKKNNGTTPLMKQYNAIKGKYPDAMLLFRVGDFYETFGEDAQKAARILDIVLTQRNNGGDQTPLAGFPHHALQTYLPKLVKAGNRVAICDQLEDPKQTKTIVKRGVTELITPGVTLNDAILEQKTNNYLSAVFKLQQKWAVAFVDVSTSNFLIASGDQHYIDKLLQNFNPTEILYAKPQKSALLDSWVSLYHLHPLEDWIFEVEQAEQKLCSHLKVNSLKGFGVLENELGISPAAAVLYYLSQTQPKLMGHINHIQVLRRDDQMWMDAFTIRNLELLFGLNREATTLFDVLDYSCTPMGGRLLKHWIALPLTDEVKINQRLKIVHHYFNHTEELRQVQDHLKSIYDLERYAAKLASTKINPRELNHLKTSLTEVISLDVILKKTDLNELQTLFAHIASCSVIEALISKAINPEAPALLQKGSVIASQYDQELDELRTLANSGQELLNEMLRRESEITGIPSLKISSNNVFGYYIEVRNTHKDKVPENWTRKQTLVNAERYITEELKTYEQKILGAEEKIAAKELELFNGLIEELQKFKAELLQTARTVARLDCLVGFADCAKKSNYCKPEIHQNRSILIKAGRHPVIEKQLESDTPYIANDIQLDPDSQQIVMITGPNMSGKSAILRQTALIVLMAQIGSYVPANSASIGIIDKLFTRVGASDNISMGESTFMVEMNETAAIVNNLSDRSLVLLDEIGRGTSTYDGISIAWAIAAYMHNHQSKAKTLFATHYHELNAMSEQYSRIKNYNVSVKETADGVLFLRKLIAGPSHHSFGIHVAQMAGMPKQLLEHAQEILIKLEESRSKQKRTAQLEEVTAQQKALEQTQLSFIQLEDPVLLQIKEDLIGLDINNLTPIEALNELNKIKKLLNKI